RANSANRFLRVDLRGESHTGLAGDAHLRRHPAGTQARPADDGCYDRRDHRDQFTVQPLAVAPGRYVGVVFPGAGRDGCGQHRDRAAYRACAGQESRASTYGNIPVPGWAADPDNRAVRSVYVRGKGAGVDGPCEVMRLQPVHAVPAPFLRHGAFSDCRTSSTNKASAYPQPCRAHAHHWKHIHRSSHAPCASSDPADVSDNRAISLGSLRNPFPPALTISRQPPTRYRRSPPAVPPLPPPAPPSRRAPPPPPPGNAPPPTPLHPPHAAPFREWTAPVRPRWIPPRAPAQYLTHQPHPPGARCPQGANDPARRDAPAAPPPYR